MGDSSILICYDKKNTEYCSTTIQTSDNCYLVSSYFLRGLALDQIAIDLQQIRRSLALCLSEFYEGLSSPCMSFRILLEFSFTTGETCAEILRQTAPQNKTN